MSAISDYLAQLNGNVPRSTVAGPSGMREAAAEAAAQPGTPREPRVASGSVQDYLQSLGGSFTAGRPQTPMTGTFRQWYTGANTNGVTNGWDTGFQQVFQKGVQAAYEKGDPYGYFTQDKATGVVTWDNAKGKGDQTFRFGDVVVDGKKVSNVYDDFDRHTANVMMGEYLIETGARKAELNEEGDPQKAWDDELNRLRTQATEMAELAPRAKQFKENVEEEVRTDADREGITAGGAVGGALLGAGIGSIVPGVGTAIGAAVGAGVGLVAGGVGAYLNSDSLAYQLARSQEQYKIASAEGAGIQAALQGIAQNTMSIGLSPFANLYRGTYDALYGGGAGEGAIGGAFEETNKAGDRKAGALAQAGDFGAMLGDALLQFASPAGRLAYQAQMTTQISSGLVGLLPGVGTWDPLLLRQNSVWTREEYNPETGKVEQRFDLGNSLAGIGTVGIDAVQLGAMSSLSRGVDRLASQTAKATGVEATGLVKTFRGDRPWERLNLSSAQRAALKEGAQLETRAGMKFVVTDAGEIVGKARGTLSMLAPSEGLQTLSAKMLARRDAARRGGAYTSEQLYNTAADLALGQRGLTAMLVNAVGEGQEEVAQQILEPLSQDHKIDAESVLRAGLAGAVTGFGMTAGARLGRPSQDMQMYALARVAWADQTNGAELGYDDWKGMDQLSKRTLVKSASGMAKALTDAAYNKIERDRIAGTIGSTVEAARLEDFRRDMANQALATGAKATDQTSPIVMHESSTFRPEVVATSHTQLLMNQQDHVKGVTAQLDRLGDEIRDAKEAAKAAPGDTNLADRVTELQNSHVSMKEVLAASQSMERTLRQYNVEIDAHLSTRSLGAADAKIAELNDTLEAMYDMTDNTYELVNENGVMETVTLSDSEVFAFSKAVSRLMTRDPADSKASWQILMPQVSEVYAQRGADGLYAVSQVILNAIRGDYDGDKMRPLHQLVLPDEGYINIRSGANILGASAKPEVGSTELELQLSTLAMGLWDSSNIPLKDAARKVATDIEADLKNRYHNPAHHRTPIRLEVLDEVTTAVQVALRTGGDVRATVLELMSQRAGGILTKIGRGQNWVPGMARLSNEYFWMANMVTRHMQEFQSAYALHTPPQTLVTPSNTVATPREATTDARTGTPARGATVGSTIINEMNGSSLFRMFQQLHYTLWETTTKYEGWAADNRADEYRQLVEFYERLSQGETEQRLVRQAESTKDQIIGQTLLWLEDMASDPVELARLGIKKRGQMALLANMGVAQTIYAENKATGRTELKFTGKEVTLGQHLLYLSLQKFKRDNQLTFDEDADQKAAYNELIDYTKPQTQGDPKSHPGNAEMAFVSIFEGVRMYDIVGADAVQLGVQRTVGQYYRELVSKPVEERKEQLRALKLGSYGDAEKGFTIPFGNTELAANSVTAFKSLVDSLFSAANSTISMNLTGKDKGKVHGRYADKSDQRSEAIRATYEAVKVFLQRVAPQKSYTADDISRIANEHKEFGTMLMRVIPDEAIPWVFKRQDPDGRVVFSSWFYEVWAQPNAELAEMSFFRNLLLDRWFAKKRELDIDTARGDSSIEKKIAYASLNSRLHRVMFRMASSSVVEQFQLKAFLTELNQATSVKKFMEYVNTTEGLAIEGAPLLAWMDDTADFDSERAGGGWTKSLSTPTLMEHVANLRSTAERLVGGLDESAQRSEADLATARAIQRWREHLKYPDDKNLVANPADETEYNRFVGLLRASAKRRMANGPRAMLQHTAHLVYGMYAPAHAKAQNPTQMAAQAALDAQDNAFGFLTTAERILGDLTAHNEDAVADAPQMILRDGGRAMNRHGSQVEWGQEMTTATSQEEWEAAAVDSMLPLMTNKDHHPLMRAVLFDTVVELDSDNVARRKFLMGSTLDEVMKGTTVQDLFNSSRAPDFTESMKFLVKMEQKLRDNQKHLLEQKVTELVIARTSALDHTASFEEIESMTVRAYMDFADLMQVIGRTVAKPGEEDPVIRAHRNLKEAAMVAAISSAYNIDAKIANGNLSNLQVLVKEAMLDPIQVRIDRLVEQSLDPTLSATDRAATLELLRAEQVFLAEMQAKIDRMFDLNVTQEIVAQYLYSSEADAATKHARQNFLMNYVYEHGELLQASGPALPTVQAIKNHFRETKANQKTDPLKLPDEKWEQLSNVIISVEIQHLLTVAPASKPPPPYPSPFKSGVKGIDKRKFWDHSYSYLFDFLAEDADDGFVQVARELAKGGGKVQQQFGRDEIISKVQNTLLRKGSLGEWTASIPIQSSESYDLLIGASSVPAVSMYGLLQQRWGATMEATARQTTDTVADAEVTLTTRDLNWMETGQFHDVTVTAGNGQTYQRPLAMMNNRFAEQLTLNYIDTFGQPATIDLMTDDNVAREWAPAYGVVPHGARFKEVNITRLNEELERVFKSRHTLNPEQLKAMVDSASVTMRFVNPDAQSSAAEHANSVWHEGTVYYSDGDMGDSLVNAFFYGVEGQNARGQQAALDTRKKGLAGIEDYLRPRSFDVRAIEAGAGVDFARMLALKTNVLMDTAVSDGKPIDVHFYNAAYKLMKLKHWVEGELDGTPVRWSAEQVIEWQMANPGQDFYADGPLANARLWLPSDQVLANMMGDIGFGGVSGRALKQDVTTDLRRVPRYESRWTEQMEHDFPVRQSQPVALTDTDVARQSFVQDLRVSSYTTPAEQTKFQRRVENMQYQSGRAMDARTQDAQRTTFDPEKNLQTNMDTAVGWVSAQDVRVNMPSELKYLQREHGDVLSKTLWALQKYVEEQQARVGRLGTSFWIFQEEGQSSRDEGRLTKGDIGGKLNLVPGEIVLIDTGQYIGMDPTEARALALKRIEYFVSQNVALMITSSRGTSDLSNELQGLTQELHGYQRYRNNNGILIPDVLNESSFQNVAAARSRLVVPTAVPLARQRVSMLTLDREIEENTMYVPVRPGRKTKFDAIQAVFDLLPFDVHSQFNTANTSDDAQKAMRWLQGLGTEGQAMLRKEATKHLYEEDKDGNPTTKLKKGKTQAQVDEAEVDFNKYFERLMVAMPDRVARNTTDPLVDEEFGTGDFVVLINSDTNELLLYRHGYSYPEPKDFQRQLRNQTPGDSGMRGIVMYSGEREPAATTHKGTVVAVRSSPGRGFRMELEIPVQELGEKIAFEHNGMKYMLTNLPSSFLVPEVPLFGDIDVDGYASMHDVLSKQATGGLVTSFQNAFTIFGIDFTADIKNFFGTDTTDEAISLLRQINRLGNKQSVEEIYQFQSMLAGQDAYLSAISGLLPTLRASDIKINTWASKLMDVSPEAAIARAMIVYLMSPNADVDAVLKSSGFFVDNPDLPNAASQKMPELFTRAFDLSAPDSPIRAELGRRINERLNQGPMRPDGTSDGWHLDVNSWELEGRVRNGRTLRGLLQFGEAVATEDNVVLNMQAQERKGKQSLTYHQLLMNRIGTGGISLPARSRLDRIEGVLRQDLTDPEQVGIMWHDLTYVDRQTYGPGARWQNRTPAEVRYYNRSIMRYGQYRHTIDLDADVFTADPKNLTDIKNTINAIVGRLGLRSSQEDLVHYWIRQMLYHPAEGKDQLAFSGDLAPGDVLGAARAILGNLDDGYLPTYDSAGPSFLAYPDLQILFEAYRAGRTKFAPYRKEGDPSTILSRDNFGEWITSAFAQVINGGVDFDPLYRLDMSGFMNTYQTMLRNSGYMMDITFDKDYQQRLIDPDSNELLTVTLDPVEQNRLTEQVLLATANLEYDDLMNGAGLADDPNSRAKGANWRARRLTARARWRARRKVHPVKVPSGRDFVRNGTELINRDSDMHSLQRIVIALRHGLAMLNPGLYFSMIPEQGFRMLISEATNMLSGESTLRSVSGAQRGVERLVSTATLGRVNFQLSQYSAEQTRALNNLFSSMGDDGAFTSLIIKDMMWHKPGDAPGRIVKAFEKFASIGNKWQDPTWGTTQKALARHYVEAIIRSIESMPTRNVMTIDSVIAHLRTDPAYFAKEHEDLHQMASNFVVDFRSLKNTPWSLAMKAMYEPWSTSPNMGKRFVGTLIKLPAMYATYNMNVLTTITGMQGYTQMVSAFLDGKKKPNSLMKLWFKARDEEKITDEDYETFDLSSTVDAFTIANAFIRGGVTQTGLFMLGMVAGGVLSGEDDEAKRRRQLAHALNAHLIMDPRRVETDFRNKDALFLDWLPPQLSAFFRVQGDDGSQGARAMAQMSWLVKPFLSPILGMERFFMTGDFHYVTAGFSDAVSSLPLFNLNTWDDAVRTANELEALAADEQQAGTPTSMKNTMFLLSSAVGVYERMLMENMFVNSLYTGFDTYDRDPTKLVLRDSDGDIQRTIENNARPNDVALTEFIGPDGKVGQGYMKRNPLEAQMAAYTENNFTAAAVMSLFTGGKRAYLRSDMPVTIRTIERPELTEAEAKVAIVLATLNSQKAQGTLERRLSLDEVTTILKSEILKAEDWDAYHNLDALALKFYQSSANPIEDPMTYIGPDGKEALTKSGHVALFKGLAGGTITLDDPSIQGIAISVDARKELERDFYTDMTRQGIDLGLTRKQAESRAKRLMLGPIDDPNILGFRDILWDKRIPWTADAKYKQLNTTYVQGPDGFPWATGFKRGGAPGSGGFFSLFGGLKRPSIGLSDAMTQDGRMNSVDLVRGINTGQRGLVPFNETELIPTDWEQTQKIIDAFKDHDVNFSNYEPNSHDTGGSRRYGGRFYRRASRGGGYSGSGYSPTIYWSRQPTLPRGTNVYGNTPKNIFWNNANVRRTTIRRERYQSERGRLKQWQ